MNWDEDLTDEQKAYASCDLDGHSVLIAGPGTGKTFTIVRKVAYMISEKKISPEDILIEAWDLYKDKESQYGDNWKRVGPLLLDLFEDFTPKSEKDWDRVHLITMIFVKLTRMVNSMSGNTIHKDSTRDLVVYAAMLDSLEEWIFMHLWKIIKEVNVSTTPSNYIGLKTTYYTLAETAERAITKLDLSIDYAGFVTYLERLEDNAIFVKD